MDKKKVRSGIRGAAFFFEFRPELRGEEFEFLRLPIITLQLSSTFKMRLVTFTRITHKRIIFQKNVNE